MGCLLTLLSTIQALKDARNGKRSGISLWLEKGQFWKLLCTIAVMVLYTRAMPFFGFTLATAILMLFLFKAIAGLAWKGAIAGAAIVAFSAYLIFEILLKVQFPEGFWQG